MFSLLCSFNLLQSCWVCLATCQVFVQGAILLPESKFDINPQLTANTKGFPENRKAARCPRTALALVLTSSDCNRGVSSPDSDRDRLDNLEGFLRAACRKQVGNWDETTMTTLTTTKKVLVVDKFFNPKNNLNVTCTGFYMAPSSLCVDTRNNDEAQTLNPFLKLHYSQHFPP